MPSGVTLTESMLQVILNFLILRTHTDTRSWFGLLNQVAWVYSLGPIMLLFCDLIKQDAHFAWNQSLEAAFQHSKQIIVDLVRKGIATFEKDHVTSLAPDWSKNGKGFLILQKHCSCTPDKAPVGWGT